MKFVKKVLLSAIVLLSAFAEGKLKPYDYEVEWLESDGNSYIATGYSIAKGPFGIDATFSSTKTRGTVIAANKSSAYLMAGIKFTAGSREWITVAWNGGQNSDSYVASYANKTRVYIGEDGRYDVNDGAFSGTLTQAGTVSCNSQICLFATSFTSITPTASGTRIYSAHIFRSGDFDLDFIPVVKSNEGMMYDKVSGKLFRNAGTGSFIVGPRKADSAVEIALGEMEVRE